MQIVIVGAGISGLCAFLYLKKELASALPQDEVLDILIYEKHRDSSSEVDALTVGGFLAIAPNGLKVIRDLDQDLYQDILSNGHVQTTFRLRSANGWDLGQMSAENFDKPPLPSAVISRQRLWHCLRKRVPDDSIGNVEIDKISFSGTARGTFRIKGGSDWKTADLIVGADGVHSVVREAVADGQCEHEAEYVGLVGVGGSLDPKIKLPDPGPQGIMTMTFGSNGFFGYGPTAAGEFGWWSTYSLPEPPSSNKAIDPAKVKTQLQDRHKGWKDPNIQKFIANVEINSIYPTWITPKLPAWSKENVVLLGDAAHAMQPSSGQGASQALEDVQVLSILLGHFAAQSDRSSAIHQAIKHYEAIRRPRVQKCVDEGNRRGNSKKEFGWVKQYMFYGFMWAFTHLMPSDPWRKFLFHHDPAEQAKALIEEEKGKRTGT